MFNKDTPIQRKLMAVILLTTSVALILSCIGFISYEIFTLHKNMARALSTRAEIIAANLPDELAARDQKNATEILNALQKDPRMVSACIYDRDGRIFARYPASAPDTLFPASPGQPGYRFETAFLSAFCPVVKDGRTLGTVYLKSNLSALAERFPGYAALAAIIFASSLLAAYLLSKILGRQISQPVHALAETARVISEHRDYSVRATKHGNDELGLLTDTFNEMVTRIQEQNQVLLRFAAIVEFSNDAIVGKTLDGTITSWNPSAEKLFGCAAAEAIGKPVLTFIPPDRVHEETEILARIARGENIEHFETVRVRKDGKRIDVSETISPIKDSQGRIIGASKIARDIGERIHARQRLETSLKEITDLQAALDEHAIVAITDPQGKITFVNDKFCAISKYSREELLGQDHRLINSGYHPKEFIRDLWTTIKHGKVWHGEMKNRAKDGSFYWVDTTIVPFLTADGKSRQFVAIRADITQRKKVESEIKQLNAELEQRVAKRTAELEAANRELESFSYSVSHDLRAPLRAISGFAAIVLEDYGPQLPEAGRQYLERVRHGGQRMGELIDDLLAFSRLSRQPLERRQVDTARLVQEVLTELNPNADNRQIEIRVGELPSCQGDPALLKQVWVNLLSNAVKYTRGRQPAVVDIGCERKNGEDVYFVRDNGVGFDMQYAKKLFGVFQRLHRADEFEGTGVGLAIVQRIVHRHGGRVWAEAEPDRGATFYFTIEAENKLEGKKHDRK
jgi:PAS domain S-box-containing protein